MCTYQSVKVWCMYSETDLDRKYINERVYIYI
jgi:hypothetical protein